MLHTTVLAFIGAMLIGTGAADPSNDIALVEASLIIDYSNPGTCLYKCSQSDSWAKSIRSDGSWSDVTYSSGSSNVWASATHWNRMATIVSVGFKYCSVPLRHTLLSFAYSLVPFPVASRLLHIAAPSAWRQPRPACSRPSMLATHSGKRRAALLAELCLPRSNYLTASCLQHLCRSAYDFQNPNWWWNELGYVTPCAGVLAETRC